MVLPTAVENARSHQSKKPYITLDAFEAWAREYRGQDLMDTLDPSVGNRACLMLLDVLDFCSRNTLLRLRELTLGSVHEIGPVYELGASFVDFDFRHVIRELVGKIDLLLAFMGPRVPKLRPPLTPLEAIADDLICRNLVLNELAGEHYVRAKDFIASRVSDTNLQESRAVRRLANLASAFLPLTLAASALSTQHRFLDEPLLLLDLTTIGLDLGAVVLVILWVTTSTKTSRLKGNVVDRMQRMYTKDQLDRYLLWLFLPICMSTLVAVNIGSFTSTRIGWKVFAFGLLAGVCFLLLHLYLSTRIESEWWVHPRRELTDWLRRKWNRW